MGITMHYFKLEKGARQGGLISAYLFVAAFEVPFVLMKSRELMKDISIFCPCVLFMESGDVSTFLSQIHCFS